MQSKEILYDEDDCPPLTEADFKVMRPFRLTKKQREKLAEENTKIQYSSHKQDKKIIKQLVA
jgi:hypothetical protein